MEKKLLYLSSNDVKSCLDIKGAIKAVKEGVKALGSGEAIQPEKIYLEVKKHRGFVKPMIAYIEPMKTIAAKVFSFFPDNPEKYGLPTVQATIILTDPETGTPTAVMDGTWITALRTGATTAIAAECLSKRDSKVVGIEGAGVQGRSHLMALNKIFKLEEVRISDVFKDIRQRFAEEMGKMLELFVIPVESPLQAVKGADIVVTATTADEPLIRKEWIERGMFIAKVGSYQEIEPEIIMTADKVVVDWWKYVNKRVKELIKLIDTGVFNRERIHAELPEIVTGQKPGRETDNEVILFISIGMGVEDAATALHVYHQALRRGIGRWLER